MSGDVAHREGRRNERLRVLIADDHPSVRENLRYLLNAETDLDVVAIAKDGTSAIQLARDLRPDVTVLDYNLPILDGLSVARVLRRECIKSRVILYTMDREACARAARAGVDECVTKDDAPAVLIDAIRRPLRPGSRRGVDVLIVEDDAETRRLMRMALEDEGLDTVSVGDGFDALVECERRTPRVVVLDLGLPTMSGEEFVTAYRRMPVHDAPLVVVSGGRDARQVAAKLGAAAFIAKPFLIPELSEAVRRVAYT
jgi:CheY-like chemotaxis protein